MSGLRINHNIAALNTHRHLVSNDRALGRSLEKLSSGMKINRAADGPASLMISEQIRAQLAGLGQAIDNSETAIAMIQTSESAINEVTALLVSMRQLAIHAANEGANDENMLAADSSSWKTRSAPSIASPRRRPSVKSGCWTAPRPPTGSASARAWSF